MAIVSDNGANLVDGDDGWQQYANFVDSVTAHLAKSPSTVNVVSQIEQKLANSSRDALAFAAILVALNNDADLRQVIGTFAEEVFPIGLIQKDYEKNNHDAARWMREGDEQFNLGHNQKAINLFSQAIRHAEETLDSYSYEDGQAFVELVANLYDRRSAAFLKSGQHYECILDIEELHRVRSGDLSPSAVLRLAHAATNLKDFSNIKRLKLILAICTKAYDAKNMSTSLEAKLQSFIEKINEMVVMLQQQPGNSKAEEVDQEMAVLGAQMDNPHPTIRGASAKVDIKFAETKGRHVVAKEPITSGNVLFIEEPFSAFSLSELHCANCFRRLANVNRSTESGEPVDEDGLTVDYFSFVACTTCNKFIFCDDKCRSAACDRFHRAECQGKLFALENHLGIAYIVLRTILVAGGPSKAIEAFHSMSTSTSSDYQAVLSLLTHSTRHDVHTSVSHVLTALFLAHSLPRFAINCSADETSALLPLLLHHLQQMSTNLVTIFEQEIISTNTGPSMSAALPMPPSKELPIGVGFYPTISLLNHSCDPDLVPLYIGSKLVLKANRALNPSAEVSFSYGPTYLKMSQLKRQKFLSEQYFFTCQCTACQKRKENYQDAFLCITCNGPAFLEENTRLVCSRNNQHINTNVAAVLDAIKAASDHLSAGENFLEQYKQREDTADLIAALVSTHKADVTCSENLFPLNSLLVKTKKSMINCYLKTGHHDRAEIYTRQLVTIFTKYLTDELQMPLLQEQLRLVKILFLRVEELLEDEDQEKSSLEDLCPLIEKALANFEHGLQYFKAKDSQLFTQMFAKEIEFACEKRDIFRQLQAQL